MDKLDIANAENSLKMIRSAISLLNKEFELDPVTNTFNKELPSWVAEMSLALNIAQNHLINAIDPNGDRAHGWWERFR